MVLKRLFLTALGALGLGALAAGTALAQDQIPAPRLYGDITGCVTDAPASVTMARSMGMRPSILDETFDSSPSALATSVQNSLRATIDPCDATGASSNAIAEGFERARSLYDAAARARILATGEGATETAIELYNQALAKQTAYGGAVYDSVYEEAAAEKAVREAIKGWNDYFADPTTASAGEDGEGAYVVAKRSYDGIVVNNLHNADGSTAVITVTDRTADNYNNPYGIDSVLGFQAVTGFDAARVQGATLTDTDGDLDDGQFLAAITDALLDAAFDGEGKLDFEQSVANTSGAANVNMDDSVIGSTAIANLGALATYLADWERAATAAQQAVADANPDTVANYDLLRQRAARITAIRDHVREERDRLLGVIRIEDRTSGTGASATTEVAILRDYDSVLRDLQSAENSVRSTAATLEAARGAVKQNLESADSYLSQLVRLRQYEKDQLNDLHDGEPPASLLRAANTALQKAQDQLAAHSALGADEGNPATTLLAELLKPTENEDGDVVDDDGLALVNAISDTYEVAKGAADQAREVVEELTGEGGQVSMNTAAISENADDIASNTTMIGENRGMIMDNTASIVENRGMIMTNSGRIDTNASEIMRVEGRVDSNWDAIAMNQSAISSNADAIASNMNSIGSNASAISDNRNMIGELSDDLDVVRAGVAASMALAGMPAINGRGVSIGIGSFDGESAFAVGFQIQGEMASFKVGVTSGGGATGASAGVGFQF